VRNVEGLIHILQHYFRVPVRIEEFVGHWLTLSAGERTRLSVEGALLGSGAVLGSHVWDRQHKFRIHLGPLTLDQYESFLPGGAPLRKLVDWVRLYLCFELDWDVRLLLKQQEVPSLTLGGRQRLGWTTWLGRRQQDTHAGDLLLDAEAFAANGARVA
jgi:type VI secretion system protein ImpH